MPPTRLFQRGRAGLGAVRQGPPGPTLLLGSRPATLATAPPQRQLLYNKIRSYKVEVASTVNPAWRHVALLTRLLLGFSPKRPEQGAGPFPAFTGPFSRLKT